MALDYPLKMTLKFYFWKQSYIKLVDTKILMLPVDCSLPITGLSNSYLSILYLGNQKLNNNKVGKNTYDLTHSLFSRKC